MPDDVVTCPGCGAAMEQLVEPDMTIDKCPACEGLFLRPGQLNALATGMEGDIEFCSIALDRGPTDERPPRLCPHCPEHPAMARHNLLGYSDVVFDFCAECRGWFLDGGEVESMNVILEQLRAARGGEEEYRGRLCGHLVTGSAFSTWEVSEAGVVQAKWMAFEVIFEKPLGIGLRISPQTWGSRLWSLLGLGDAMTGDDEFDQTFHVRATDTATALEILGPRSRQALLRFHKSPLAKVGKRRTFEVLDDRIVFCYSAWGSEEHRPTEKQARDLRDALAELADTIESEAAY